jgi:hypothetical protein
MLACRHRVSVVKNNYSRLPAPVTYTISQHSLDIVHTSTDITRLRSSERAQLGMLSFLSKQPYSIAASTDVFEFLRLTGASTYAIETARINLQEQGKVVVYRCAGRWWTQQVTGMQPQPPSPATCCPDTFAPLPVPIRTLLCRTPATTRTMLLRAV